MASEPHLVESQSLNLTVCLFSQIIEPTCMCKGDDRDCLLMALYLFMCGYQAERQGGY